MKIYLSSTFKDLREHRAAVDLALRRMGHDVIGMEQYVAEEMTPLARSIKDVAAADAYLVIVGWRYGSVPDDQALNPKKRSITELEFETAVKESVPVLAFLLDPDAPWPASSFDAMTDKGGKQIAEFRSRLGSNYLAGIFSTPDNLASQAVAAVASQGASRQMTARALQPDRVAGEMLKWGHGEHELDDTALQEITKMIASAGNTRVVQIDIGDGDQWWSTRLYLLAALAQTLTAIRQFLFSEGDRFAGMASPAAVREGLCSAFPELAAFDGALRAGPASKDVDREIQRTTTLWDQRMSTSEAGLKVGVRWHLLAEWLGERFLTRCIRVDRKTGLTMVQVQQVVDSLIPDVPIEQPADLDAPPADLDAPPDQQPPAEQEYELKVVDRDAFALELAREWVRTGIPRAPLR
jgi:Domain of unknown function (DUF4062)